MEGDVIVMGSDGLFDNVFDDEIVSIISRYKEVTEAGKCLPNQFFRRCDISNQKASFLTKILFLC